MNILILGSGGREHAFVWKLLQSEQCEKVFVAPGNAGTSQIAKNINLNVNDFQAIKDFVLSENIEMLVVGPEDPLVNGIHDFFLADSKLKNVIVIGPEKLGATLEGSKEFTKQFLIRHNIPTAAYQSFTAETVKNGCLFLETLKAPYVLKADGLAAGKGVLILENLKQAKQALKEMLIDAKFGDASKKVVIEEFLDGIEMSCFVLTDGKSYKILPYAKDYKRIGEGNIGLNTGGMGAISPVPFLDKKMLQKIENRIVKPTINGLQKDNIPYKGFVFIGLISVNNEPFVIEYNVRMGDPETEVVLPRIKTDLLKLFKAIGNQTLNEVEIELDDRSACTVMMVSGGYPEAYKKGKEITGIQNVTDSIVFHAGTTLQNDKIVTNGGRVITVTSYGKNYKECLETSYKNIKKINFEKMYYRTDLGFDL